jgi:hypothetical protein
VGDGEINRVTLYQLCVTPWLITKYIEKLRILNMKLLSFVIVVMLTLIGCRYRQTDNKSIAGNNEGKFIDSTDMTNNFYDNTETFPLPVNDLTIEGEIANPGKVDFSMLEKHTVIVKETLLDSAGGDRFTGAFRYDGYSLFDILEKRIINKSNSGEFNSVIDLYIEVESKTGEKVVFSWGEIYYPNSLHKILIASDVSRIVPSKTKELWPLPEKSRIVAAADLITERNIADPVRIIVKSYPGSYPTVKGLSPMYSPDFELFDHMTHIGRIASIPETVKDETFNTIFYGRGKGIHSTSPFTGSLLKEILLRYFPLSREKLQKGMMCLVGMDGYRCAVSYSELFNRNDQQEFLLIKSAPDEDGGLFRVFAASDFFSDRAIKSLSGVHLVY